jgi:ectoine hydroxylase-related dioxygenase (phytanoyl-CoA dioxygenase family)
VAIQEPRTEAAAHFARDENLLPVANGSGCSMWICLDSVPESESQVFLRGSHRHPERSGLTPNQAQGETLLRFATAPGDLIVYDLRTYRAPGGNSSSHRRRGLALHYCDETMSFRRQAGISTRALYPGLKDGGPLDSPDFPVVWPRPYPAFAIATLYENAAPALDDSRRGRK